MKKSIVALATLFAVAWTVQASAGPDVRKAFNVATKATTLTRSSRVVEQASLKSGARTGSFATSFKNAHNARQFSRATDAAGNVHTTTRRLADHDIYSGLRFESKQMVTPAGTNYKTSRIIDSKDDTVTVRGTKNGGYPVGQ